MFGTKKTHIKLEDYSFTAGLTLITRLATDPEFHDLTFGLNGSSTRMSIKGPTASVNRFIAIMKSLA